MANSKQAAKRARQANSANLRNRTVKSEFRGEARKLLRLVKDKDLKGAEQQVRVVESKVDKAAKRNVIKAGTAARIKSRLKGKVAAAAKA